MKHLKGLFEAKKDDILFTYYNNGIDTKVVTYVHVQSDTHICVLGGLTSTRTIISITRDGIVGEPTYGILIRPLKRQGWLERITAYTDVDFFLLDKDEANLALAEFI